MLVPATVLNLHSICGESLRYVMSGALFARDDAGCFAVATDSVCLLIARWKDAERTEKVTPDPAFQRIIPAHVLAAAAKLFRKSPREYVTIVEPAQDERYVLNLRQKDHDVDFRGLSLVGRFPPWKEILAGDEPDASAALPTFDSGRLAKLLTTATEVACPTDADDVYPKTRPVRRGGTIEFTRAGKLVTVQGLIQGMTD